MLSLCAVDINEPKHCAVTCSSSSFWIFLICISFKLWYLLYSNSFVVESHVVKYICTLNAGIHKFGQSLFLRFFFTTGTNADVNTEILHKVATAMQRYQFVRFFLSEGTYFAARKYIIAQLVLNNQGHNPNNNFCWKFGHFEDKSYLRSFLTPQ